MEDYTHEIQTVTNLVYIFAAFAFATVSYWFIDLIRERRKAK